MCVALILKAPYLSLEAPREEEGLGGSPHRLCPLPTAPHGRAARPPRSRWEAQPHARPPPCDPCNVLLFPARIHRSRVRVITGKSYGNAGCERSPRSSRRLCPGEQSWHAAPRLRWGRGGFRALPAILQFFPLFSALGTWERYGGRRRGGSTLSSRAADALSSAGSVGRRRSGGDGGAGDVPGDPGKG